jgi:hypothetical protein
MLLLLVEFASTEMAAAEEVATISTFPSRSASTSFDNPAVWSELVVETEANEPELITSLEENFKWNGFAEAATFPPTTTVIGSYVVPAGTVTVNDVVDAEVTDAFAPPKLTMLLDAVALKFVPVITTDEPEIPDAGENEVIVGTCARTIAVVTNSKKSVRNVMAEKESTRFIPAPDNLLMNELFQLNKIVFCEVRTCSRFLCFIPEFLIVEV